METEDRSENEIRKSVKAARSTHLGGIDLVVQFQDQQHTVCDQFLGQRLLVRVESYAVGLQGGNDVKLRVIACGAGQDTLPYLAWAAPRAIPVASASL